VDDRAAENAKKLMAGAMVFAANSRDGFVSHYPTLDRVSPEEWTSLLVVAGTATALLMLPERFEAGEQKEITATVIANLHGWDSGAVQNLANLINFVTAEARDSTQVPDLVGAWVVRNVELADSEQSAPHVIGTMLVNTFAHWWDQ
jgi:hypothetical protein